MSMVSCNKINLNRNLVLQIIFNLGLSLIRIVLKHTITYLDSRLITHKWLRNIWTSKKIQNKYRKWNNWWTCLIIHKKASKIWIFKSHLTLLKTQILILKVRMPQVHKCNIKQNNLSVDFKEIHLSIRINRKKIRL